MTLDDVEVPPGMAIVSQADFFDFINLDAARDPMPHAEGAYRGDGRIGWSSWTTKEAQILVGHSYSDTHNDDSLYMLTNDSLARLRKHQEKKAK